MEWWLNAATLLGWLLSTIFALSLAWLARCPDPPLPVVLTHPCHWQNRCHGWTAHPGITEPSRERVATLSSRTRPGVIT